MMCLLKGLLISMAGPTAGYGMQHILSTSNPREAALENWWMSIVVLAVTSVIMKFTWYDKLGPGDMYMPEDE